MSVMSYAATITFSDQAWKSELFKMRCIYPIMIDDILNMQTQGLAMYSVKHQIINSQD